MQAPELSVVICTRNQCAGLAESLDALSRQQSGARWETLVVDNGSRDATAQVVTDRVETFPVPLRLIREEREGLSYARNRGADAARGGVLLYIDDDASVQPGWLEAHRQAFLDATIQGAGGPVEPQLPPDTPDWLRRAIFAGQGGPSARYEFGDEPSEIREQGPVLLPFGCNMAIRRDRLRELGGFRDDLGWGREMLPGEETALFSALLRAGGRLTYSPEARVVHRIKRERLEPDQYLSWYRAYGRASVRMAPAPSRLVDWFRNARDVVRFSRHSLASLAHPIDQPAGLDRRCRRERALGRMQERLAGGGRRG